MVVPTAFPANNLWFQMTPISITHLFTNLWYQIEGNHLPIWVKSNGVGLDSNSDWKPMNQQLVAATVRRPRGGRCGMYFIPPAQVQKYHTQRAADCSLLLLYNLYISLHCFKLSIPRNRSGNEIWLQNNPHWSSPFLRAFLQPRTNPGPGFPVRRSPSRWNGLSTKDGFWEAMSLSRNGGIYYGFIMDLPVYC
jgi:hypothetical protein